MRTESKSVEQTIQQAMATDNVIAMQLQNLYGNINIDLQYTENDSQNIWTKSLRDQQVFAIREVDNRCLKGMNSRKIVGNTMEI